MLCGRSGHLVQYAFVPARHEQSVTLSDEVVLAVAVSGVAAEKTGPVREAYNAISARARRLLQVWRAGTGRDDISLGAALASSEGAADALRAIVVASAQNDRVGLLERLQQFVLESTILVPAGATAFATHDWTRLRRVAQESHAAADRFLGNQTAETNGLVQVATEAGALAASAFGAGFGGSVWALLPREQAQAILARWRAAYAALAPAQASRAEFFLSGAGAAAQAFPW
jgi:galactokinase